MKNECEGCVAYNSHYGEKEVHCQLEIIPYISETLQCPCRTCIVKIVCVTTCIEYKNYVTRSNKYIREKNI